jgi:hypothetical protein
MIPMCIGGCTALIGAVKCWRDGSIQGFGGKPAVERAKDPGKFGLILFGFVLIGLSMFAGAAWVWAIGGAFSR